MKGLFDEMTNLEKLKQIINQDDKELIKWLEHFWEWCDPGGWYEERVLRMYLNDEYNDKVLTDEFESDKN